MILQFIITNILAVFGLSGALVLCAAVVYFFPQFRKWAIIAAALCAWTSATYMKGRWDQRAQDREIAQKEYDNAKQKGLKGQAEALKKLKENKLPDTWFRDEE